MRAPVSGGGAERLAVTVRSRDAPDDLIEARLALARSVAGQLGGAEPVVAAIVVGSTALGRCSSRADLDLVVVTPDPPGDDRFATRMEDGTRVEIERLGVDEALAATAGEGWVWELREASRLGTGVPVLDPDGFGAGLAGRAAAMAPAAEPYEGTLRGVYHALIEVAGHPEADPSPRLDAVRGCLDNLTLLALLVQPRRYQKPKWALADLLHAGQADLVDAVLAGYGIDDGDPAPALAGARRLIDRVYELAGVPDHDELLAIGHAPDWAEASYVSRTLDDADDLTASDRPVEARYTAAFAARLSAGVLAAAGDTAGNTGDDDVDDTSAGVIDVFAAHGLDDRYLALFAEPAAPVDALLETALATADALRVTFEEVPA